MPQSNGRSNRHPLFWPVFIGCLALLIRLAAMQIFRAWETPNTLEYGQIAAHILAGDGFSFSFYGLRPHALLKSFFPPLYPALLAFFLKFVPQPYIAMLLLQIILSAATSANVYMITLKLLGLRTAIIAGIITAFYPVFIISSAGSYFPVTQDIFFISLCLLLLIRLSGEDKLKEAAILGCCWGIAALSLPQMLGFMPLAAIWLWINRSPRWITKAVVMAATMLLLITPWSIRNYKLNGHLSLISTNGGFNFWMGNAPFTTGIAWTADKDIYAASNPNPNAVHFIGEAANVVPTHDNVFLRTVQETLRLLLPPRITPQVDKLPEVELDRQFWMAGMDSIRQNPVRYIQKLGDRLLYLWIYRPPEGRDKKFVGILGIIYVLHYVLPTLLAAAGIWLTRNSWQRTSVLYMPVIYFTAVYMNFFVLSRYRWLVEPYVIILAAASIVWYIEKYFPRLGIWITQN